MPVYLGSQKIKNVTTSFSTPGGGINTDDATLTSGAQLVSNITAYSQGKKITGTAAERTAASLSSSGNVVTVPSGFYSETVTKEIAKQALPTPTVSINDTGLVTAAVSLGSAGYVDASNTSKTMQLETQSSGTFTPTTSEQVIVPARKYTTGPVIMGAISTEEKTITSNGTYTPTDGSYFSSVFVNIPSEGWTTQKKTATPSLTEQTITPDDGYDGLSEVTVKAISVQDKIITPTTTQQTIIPDSGYNGLASVTINAINNQSKTITPNENAQTVKPDTGYQGLSQVTVQAISLQNKEVEPATIVQTIQPDTGYTGLKSVTINAIDVSEKTISSNGTYSPADGTYYSKITVNVPKEDYSSQEKTVSPSTVSQIITPDAGYDGLSKVTVSAATLQDKIVTPTTSKQTVSADSGYYGLGSVDVGAISTETKTVTANGTYSPTSGKYFSSVTVNVPSDTFTTQTKTVAPSTSEQTVTPDTGYNGLSKVTVSAIKNQSKTVSPKTTAQTVSPDSGYNGLSSVTINAATLQSKTVSPSTTSQSISADSGYYGLSGVTVNAASLQSKIISPATEAQEVTADSDYFGLEKVTIEAAALQSKTVSPSTSSQTVYADTGYYGLNGVTVGAMNLTTATIVPTTSQQTANAESAGYDGFSQVVIGAIKTETKEITANGTYTPSSSSRYFSSVTVNVDTTPNLQSKSATPSESSQTIKADSSYDGLSSVTVGAISSTYIGSGITQKSATTYTPTTSNQIIAAGQYLSGAQTIAGDSDLVASNIKSGVSIFNVTGTYTSDATAAASNIESGKTAYVSGAKITGTMEIQSYYSGTTAPTSSIGVDGDIYFMTE